MRVAFQVNAYKYHTCTLSNTVYTPGATSNTRWTPFQFKKQNKTKQKQNKTKQKHPKKSCFSGMCNVPAYIVMLRVPKLPKLRKKVYYLHSWDKAYMKRVHSSLDEFSSVHFFLFPYQKNEKFGYGNHKKKTCFGVACIWILHISCI